MLTATCPSAADLELLFLGGLPEKDTETLEQHVLDCGSCLATLKELCRTREPLAGVLEVQSRDESFGTGRVVDELLKQLEGLRLPLASSSPQGIAMLTFPCSAC